MRFGFKTSGTSPEMMRCASPSTMAVFPDAGLANQHGVVLSAPRQDLHDAPDFFIAADHRIELAAASQLRQVARILLDGPIGGFGILRGDTMAASNGRHRLQDGVVADAVARQELPCRILIR